MAARTSPRTSRRLPALGVAAAVIASAAVIGVSSPVRGAIASAGQLCFGVNGAPGDAAIVNLTPVNATATGYGLLISSDVKGNPPYASNANYSVGSIDPNVAVASIGSDGQVCYQNSPDAGVDLIADHLGTIAANAYTPASANGAPDRRVDTRSGLGTQPPAVRAQCAMPSTTRYDTTTAGTLFGLASQAYEIEPGSGGEDSLLDSIGAPDYFRDRMGCWRLVAALRGNHGALREITDTEVIVARNVDTGDLAVAFRGTELDVNDIITDLSFSRAPLNVVGEGTVDDAVHAGFLAAYRAVRSQLLAVIAGHEREGGTRIYFTGHSLGGALATIASIDLVDELTAKGYERTEVVTYTFGAPRSLSLQMSNLHNDLLPASYAVANPSDPVPHVPSTNIFNDNPYAHIHEMRVLHGSLASTTVRRNAGDGRNYRSCARLLLNFEVGDHLRPTYGLRVGATRYLGPPTVGVTRIKDPLYVPILNPFPIDNLVMNWTDEREGPCDQVALWEQSSQPTSLSGAERDVFVSTWGSSYITTLNVDDANWIGYVDMFGKVISVRSFDLDR